MANPAALLKAINGIIVEALREEGRVVDAVALANHLVITYSQSGTGRFCFAALVGGLGTIAMAPTP
jgi:hypothetical protein